MCISADAKMVLTLCARQGLRSSIVALPKYLYIVFMGNIWLKVSYHPFRRLSFQTLVYNVTDPFVVRENRKQ